MPLPENLDQTYDDKMGDPTVALHQQHHDELHRSVNSLTEAYAVAQSLGFVGTMQDWLESFAQKGKLSHTHHQSIATTTWTINHELGFRPAGIVVIDSAGTQWFCGDIEHQTIDRTILRWSAPFSGTAYLS